MFAIYALLEKKVQAAREELIKSQGGLPPEKCLDCHWTAQAGGKVLALDDALTDVKKMFNIL